MGVRLPPGSPDPEIKNPLPLHSGFRRQASATTQDALLILFSTGEGRIPASGTFLVNLSEVMAITTGPQFIQHTCFQWFGNGKAGAKSSIRRSGAQRGALENNFGQRFSWAPLAYLAPQNRPSPL